MNWENGQPNARYWVLKLLKDNFGPGDKLVSTSFDGGAVATQAFITKKGKKILLINKQNKEVEIVLASTTGGLSASIVDVTTGENPPATLQLKGNSISLKPFAVAVVEVK